jgi:putative DNA primase/helicase
MTDSTEPGPFQRAARLYRAAGWLGTLPLGQRPGMKGPPVSGFTGHDGRYPDGGDIGTWLSSPLAAHNIGLRMPPGVIGLDIDAGYSKAENGKTVVKRGEDTLAELEAKWGPLPPTWVSSARPAPSGIRFYRVPEQLDGRPINWPGEAGKFIEIIQPGHRYAVVWPSTNPDADGARYEWRTPNGNDAHTPPAVDELPPLPEAWVRGLALDYDRSEKADVSGGAAGEWFGKLRDGDPCPIIHSTTSRALAALREIDGSRHETARDALRAVVAAGGSGHRGAPAAVAALYRGFVEAVGESRADGGEWQRLVKGAIQLAVTDHPTPKQMCSDDIPQLQGMVLPPGFMPTPGSAVSGPGVAQPEPTDVPALVAEVEALPTDERDTAVRHIAEQLAATASEVDLQAARGELTAKAGLSAVKLGEWDAIVRDARRRAKEAAKATAIAQAQWEARAQVEARREEGRLLPPPHAPIDVARELVEQLPAVSRWWRGDFYQWDGTRYRHWRDEAVDNWLYGKTADAQFDAGDDKGPVPWRPDEVKVNKVAHALSRGLLYRPSELEPDDSPNQVACANGVYDVPTGQLLPHSPERFNLASLPFAYDPSAKAPLWEWFLNDVLPADAQLLLQEWFGYMVSGRTDMEKILHMQGLPRSGKGTVAQQLELLLGEDAVASPSMPSLVGTFGEQPLIGKSMAIMSDINWSFRDIVEGVEIVKKISGRDTRDVNRKNREVWHGKLGVRFVIMGNDMPKFTDASGALAYRMLHIQFPGTVQGREDPTLKDRLRDELPGILNWALVGLARLTANRAFTTPQSSAELAADVRRQQGPVQAFLEDTCARADGATPVPLDELFPVYRAWAKAADVAHTLDRERFSSALTSAGLSVKRSTVNGVRARRVHGIVPQLTQVEGQGAVSEWALLLNPAMRTPATGAPVPDGFMPGTE